MTYEEFLAKKTREKWLKSQQKWHTTRVGQWHKNQANHYKRQIKQVWHGVTFSDILTFTIRSSSTALAQNIMENNALFHRLKLADNRE